MIAACLLALAALAPSAGAETRVRQRVDPGFDLADLRVADLNGDGRAELVLVGRGGEVAVWSAGEEGELRPLAGDGRLERLAEPDRSLLALQPARPGEPPWLWVLSRSGLSAHVPDARGGLARQPLRAAVDVALELRPGAPRFAPIARDVDADGRVDLLVPGVEACELWLGAPAGGDAPEAGGWPDLARAARIALETRHYADFETADLSNRLKEVFVVPALWVRDVNGDGRPDLWVRTGTRRAFHLQRAAGGFGDEPDVSVDLRAFRDTTPLRELAPGRTVVSSEDAHFESKDLDGDGALDFVIAHRRKLWVFPGGPDGPQFERPATVLRSPEDVTALVLAPLDEDGDLDLVLLRLEIPGVATLARGLFGSWSVTVTAAGYEHLEGGRFAPAPRWESRQHLVLPSLLAILRRPGDFLRRFAEEGRRTEASARLDWDGDGTADVALAEAGRPEIALWRVDGAAQGGAGEPELDVALARLFFDERGREWPFDEAVAWLGGQEGRRIALLTGGRAPDAGAPRRDDERWRLAALAGGDVDGDGRDELVVAWEGREPPAASAVDVIGWEIDRDGGR